MAMDINEKVQFTGSSTVNGVVAERYNATIDKANPENLVFSRIITNMQLRKDNREQCRSDMAAFEDDVYAVQDTMLEENAVKENLNEDTDTADAADIADTADTEEEAE